MCMSQHLWLTWVLRSIFHFPLFLPSWSRDLPNDVSLFVLASGLDRLRLSESGLDCQSPYLDAELPMSSADLPATNTGSLGHPELRQRPCLFFIEGNCASGHSCKFCHLEHPKRPPHLDKRCREHLKSMSFAEVLGLLLPVLAEKLTALSSYPPELARVLNQMIAGSMERYMARQCAYDKRLANIQSACSTLSIRSLLTLLQRSAQEASSEPAALHQLSTGLLL
ncbi:unnamed protein product [Polarella glacialis]|uniref:C3H1-type domain-containing protein n=1 Tax=Polarella glacialis TaxID=89957 RepID=A0A813I8S8_POLGL|nr:unnamed protein product [Polarella glacialis]